MDERRIQLVGKIPNKGQCIHCLRTVGDLTSDHVFPKAWYPDTTPQNLEKWQAPSCGKCNGDYGRLEENLLIRFGMCMDTDAPGSSGIGKKVIDALNPARARDQDDFRIRLKKALTLLTESKAITPGIPKICINSGPASDGVSIGDADLKRLGEKITRGFIWVHLKRVVEDKYEIKVNTKQEPIPEFDSELQQFGARYDRGPGIDVKWAQLPEDTMCGMFIIIIFGKVTLRSLVLPKSAVGID